MWPGTVGNFVSFLPQLHYHDNDSEKVNKTLMPSPSMLVCSFTLGPVFFSLMGETNHAFRGFRLQSCVGVLLEPRTQKGNVFFLGVL